MHAVAYFFIIALQVSFPVLIQVKTYICRVTRVDQKNNETWKKSQKPWEVMRLILPLAYLDLRTRDHHIFVVVGYVTLSTQITYMTRYVMCLVFFYDPHISFIK